MAELVDHPIREDEARRPVENPAAGAILTFSGVVRDNHRGRQVTGIEYHAYEGMALKELQKIENEIHASWPELRATIVHRVGYLGIGEASVFIAIASPHRAAGFEALRFAIDQIKESVPIWKKEIYTDGHAWLEGS